jgi:hypothetical protein
MNFLSRNRTSAVTLSRGTQNLVRRRKADNSQIANEITRHLLQQTNKSTADIHRNKRNIQLTKPLNLTHALLEHSTNLRKKTLLEHSTNLRKKTRH